MKSLSDYIKYMLIDSDSIGVIHFDSVAEIVMPMTQLNDMLTRAKAIELTIGTDAAASDKISNVWNGECQEASSLVYQKLGFNYCKGLNKG